MVTDTNSAVQERRQSPDSPDTGLLAARSRTRAAVREIAREVAPGMREEDGLALVFQTLRRHGLRHEWHEPRVRFGVNTLKKFCEPSEPGIVLGRYDIWLIDVGPVWDGWESDFGETFVVGDDPEMHRIVYDVREVFDRVRLHWREARATGEALYRYAAAEASLRGWQLCPEMVGHRIGKYPFAAHHEDTLAQAKIMPEPGAWMLEIQLRHPDRPYSAFVEDLLLDRVKAS